MESVTLPHIRSVDVLGCQGWVSCGSFLWTGLHCTAGVGGQADVGANTCAEGSRREQHQRRAPGSTVRGMTM
eukprot:223702-Pyramimonas_sp.AAC.1